MEGAVPGFFGKMPGRGDFVTRRLNRAFLDEWDNWLQRAVADSKAALGSDWLNTYLTSPLWRFVLSKDLCDRDVWAGVMMPSVDRVGRYFPLTIAVAVPATASPFQIAAAGADWFDRAETQILSALDEQDFDLDAFDAAVEQLGVPMMPEPSENDTGAITMGATQALRVGLESVNGLGSAFYLLLDREFVERYQTYSLWWSAGSELVSPSLAVSSSLPPAEAYASLISGRWQDGTWLNLSPEESAVLDEFIEAEPELPA